MGLDMYLYAEKFVSGYDFDKNHEKDMYNKVVNAIGGAGFASADSPSLTVKMTAMYWRKQNAIHNWFVHNVQDGVDECKAYYVSPEQLIELRNTCQAVLDDPTLAPTLLPTQAGFFFGGTEYDDWYWAGLRSTIEGIDNLFTEFLKQDGQREWSFEYQSSW